MNSTQQKPHILVVDDDDRLRSLLKRYLREQGFFVTVSQNVQTAEKLLEWFVFDLLVLDVMMPGETGTAWLKRARVSVPVLMLSALGEPADRIGGLEVGAEDYLSKPFEPKELVLRIQAILRRTQTQNIRKQWRSFGEYRFDTITGQLRRGEEAIHLTSSETEILRMLVQHAPAPVSRERLAGLLPEGSNERSVDVQMSRLRKKIEVAPGKPAYVQTIRGEGYVLYLD